MSTWHLACQALGLHTSSHGPWLRMYACLSALKFGVQWRTRQQTAAARIAAVAIRLRQLCQSLVLVRTSAKTLIASPNDYTVVLGPQQGQHCQGGSLPQELGERALCSSRQQVGDKLPSCLHLWCHDQGLVFAYGGMQYWQACSANAAQH